MRTQGFSKNPGADQVTSKGGRVGALGGRGSGKAAPSDNDSLPQPQGGSYSPRAVRSQQLQPGRIEKHPVMSDYADDGKSYGAGGNKDLASNLVAPTHHRM